ncbi:hypothetical protein Nepgr_021733 [Nepenthes gracilis]|uniref:PPM-type phosphatase domain-containing protein n=1 Tax=Nepenthes gracilis TaxID=150966 RepID=A0AAD3T0K3_NEPGR|nr:hypothetical protein Nepgr_021733 [Nepenthes gracilis]
MPSQLNVRCCIIYSVQRYGHVFAEICNGMSRLWQFPCFDKLFVVRICDALELRFLLGDDGADGKVSMMAKKPPWMTPISHGYHVEGQTFRIDQSSSLKSDTIVVQGEQIEHLELWFYGVSDARIDQRIARYMQSHLFNRKPNETRRKSKEMIRRAYLSAQAEFREMAKADDKLNISSASILVVNGEKLVIANMGDYRAVVCRDGVAHQLRHNYAGKRHWSRSPYLPQLTNAHSGVIRRMPKLRIRARSSTKEASTGSSKSSELIAAAERVDSETNFIILSSNGVWEVTKNQEAINHQAHR